MPVPVARETIGAAGAGLWEDVLGWWDQASRLCGSHRLLLPRGHHSVHLLLASECCSGRLRSRVPPGAGQAPRFLIASGWVRPPPRRWDRFATAPSEPQTRDLLFP